MNESVTTLLERRKNKAIAIVLGVKEREIDPELPGHLRDKMRKVVLDQFNDYHELCLDVFRSLDNGEVHLNQMWLDKISEIHEMVKNGN